MSKSKGLFHTAVQVKSHEAPYIADGHCFRCGKASLVATDLGYKGWGNQRMSGLYCMKCGLFQTRPTFWETEVVRKENEE